MKFRAGSLQNKGERLAQRKLWVWKHVVEIVPHIDASLLCTLPVVEKIGVEIRPERLCCVVLCCVVLCCVVLGCVLCCVVLCWVVLCCVLSRVLYGRSRVRRFHLNMYCVTPSPLQLVAAAPSTTTLVAVTVPKSGRVLMLPRRTKDNCP